MSLEKLYAQAYILHTIDELDRKTTEQLMNKFPPCLFASVDDALRSFEREESVRVDVVEWIQETWEQSKGLTPKAFANEILDDFLEVIG